MKEIAVTGMGAVSALGNGVQPLWHGLMEGRSGVKPITGFEVQNLRNMSAGEIVIHNDMAAYANRMNINNRLLLFTCLGIDEALADRGLARDQLYEPLVGIVMGTSLGMSLSQETIFYPPNKLPETTDLAEDLNLYSAQIRERYHVRGDVVLISTACASGAHAIGMAKDMIAYENYDMVICGGADTLDRMKYLGHTALNTLTPTSIRPCDPERNGTLFGEGSAFLVLEKGKHNPLIPPVYAYCRGTGYSCDAYHVTTPDPQGGGAVHAMRQALSDAALDPEDIDHINLHGSGTKLNDSVEAHAITTVFGDGVRTIPATSVKPAIGHTMGAAGALEAVVSILSLKRGRIPVTQNSAQVDPDFAIRLVCSQPETFSGDHVMSNSFGFGGSNGVLIFSTS